jgi:hypothetical protein
VRLEINASPTATGRRTTIGMRAISTPQGSVSDMTPPLLLHGLIAAFKAMLGFRAPTSTTKSSRKRGETKQENADLKTAPAAQERINQAQVDSPETAVEMLGKAKRGTL